MNNDPAMPSRAPRTVAIQIWSALGIAFVIAIALLLSTIVLDNVDEPPATTAPAASAAHQAVN